MKTVWHIVSQDVMFFPDSFPVTDEKQVATHGYSTGALVLNSGLCYS